MPPRSNEGFTDLEIAHALGMLEERIRALDEKYKIMADEAEKRNGQRFDAQQEAVSIAMVAAEKTVSAAMAAAEKAVTKAETAAEKRFESVNEFRATLSDQASNFLTRTEYSVQHTALSEKFDVSVERIAALEKRSGEVSGRGTGRNDVWAILVAVAGIGIAAAALFLHGR